MSDEYRNEAEEGNPNAVPAEPEASPIPEPAVIEPEPEPDRPHPTFEAQSIAVPPKKSHGHFWELVVLAICGLSVLCSAIHALRQGVKAVTTTATSIQNQQQDLAKRLSDNETVAVDAHKWAVYLAGQNVKEGEFESKQLQVNKALTSRLREIERSQKAYQERHP